MTAEHVLTLTTPIYGGETLGRLPDGRAVFVPFTLPGEKVRLRLVEEKPRYARAALVEILEASAGRETPRCRHYGECGGCHYQHIAYARQVEIKTEVLRDQLQRIGKQVDPPVRPMVPCPHPWNYRNHVQFHLTEAGRPGFVAVDGEGVLPIGECHLPEESINRLWPALDIEQVPGLRRVALRAGAQGDMMLVLESDDPRPVALELEASLSVVHLGPGGALVLAGDDHLVMEVHGRAFRVSAGSFFQVNTVMAEAMVTHLLENLALSPADTLLDVYCGVGLFSAFLAPRVGRLIGVEASPYAAEDFVVNLDEFDHVELYEAPAEAVLPSLDVRPDVILVDPPRAGLAKAVREAILHLRPRALVYVSCDPATLARDAARLSAGGYRLAHITPFDLFPQTYHIESVSLWYRAAD